MLGAIIGDIIGSVYEFMPTKKKDFELFAKGSSFTDDTVMTVAVAETLIDARDIASDDEIRSLLTASMQRWGRKYPYAGYGARFASCFAMLRSGGFPFNSSNELSICGLSPCAPRFLFLLLSSLWAYIILLKKLFQFCCSRFQG